MNCLVLPCADCLSMYGKIVIVLLCLQISESLKRFGVQPDTKHLLVCRFDADDTDVSISVVPTSSLLCQICCFAHCQMHSHM